MIRLADLAATILVLSNLGAVAAEPFELRSGDRVVLIGDTLIEREQAYGYLELALTTRFPDRNVTFRNIGWSADTPAGDSRLGLSLLQAGLEPADEGWKQLSEQVKSLRPTVAILGYGMASSFAGPSGLPRFRADLERLIDTIQQSAAPNGVRFVLLSPIRHQPADGTAPAAVDAHNRNLEQFARSIRELAAERKATFVSLFDAMSMHHPLTAITDNGIHLNGDGYRKAAVVLESALGWPAGTWRTSPQAERLRQAIVRKSEHFFHRSRPANMAYIMGFRRGEQGQNAVEIPKFDPLIEAEERVISQLRSLKPVDLPPPAPPRTKSAVAKFVPQPRPSFQVGDGLEVTLWAENPQLFKPIQMNFDARGRLWVASSEVYPQIEPGQTANDKILILEDTTGAGRADKSTVFADGLLIPTGVEPGDGGVYVAQSTELLHLRDTDGDGKADSRRIVLSGFGTEDTHHNLHTLRWGHDGRLYMNQSIYTRTDTETPSGVLRLHSGGVLRLQPKTLAFETLFRGWVNAWGHDIDSFGQSFITDGAGGDGISWGVPGASYNAAARARRILKSVSPGNYPKFCGLEIVQSSHFPDDWQGSYVTCDFRANRVVRFRSEDDGAGYTAREVGDVLRSTESSFRPIDVKFGPDGALYVADWSNPIINHGEVDFRDPRRDREHGRIWRITAKGRPLNARNNLVDATNVQLFVTLLSGNAFDRTNARRVLIERGPGVLSGIDQWLLYQSTESAALQALWLKQALATIDVALLKRVLNAGDGRIRAAGVRVLGEWCASVPDALALVSARLTDDHPRVRLEALRALGRIPNANVLEQAFAIQSKPRDRFLDYALYLTVNDLADPWLKALDAGELALKGREAIIETVLTSIEPEKAGRSLGLLLARQPLTRDGRGPWIELIGQAGGANELRLLLDAVAKSELDAPANLRALRALEHAARLRRLKPPGDLDAVGRFLDDANGDTRIAAVTLVGRWALAPLTSRILAIAGDAQQPAPLRIAAIDALRELRGQAAILGLMAIVNRTGESAELRRHAALALYHLEPIGGLTLLRSLLAERMDEQQAMALWRAVLSLQGFSRKLAMLIRDEPIPEATVAIGLRIVRENAGRHRDLEQVLTRLAGGSAPRTWTPDDVKRLTADAARDGNAERGELVYRRAELRCVACHAIGGAGGKVGSDLASIGASAPLDYIVESMLFPDKAIKEGFHSQRIDTHDGKAHIGILVRETNTEVILREADGREIAIARNAIDERSTSGSLMPAALADGLFDGERNDLFKFLSELGKPGRFDSTKNQSARLWQIGWMQANDAAKAERGDASLPGWTPLTATVDGALLGSEVRKLRPADPSRLLYASTRIEVPKAARIRLEFDPVPQAIWIDGRPVEAKNIHTFDLSSGLHALVVQFAADAIPERFTVRSADAVFRSEW